MKPTTKKWLIIGVSLIIAGAITYFAFFRKPKGAKDEDSTGNDSTQGNTTSGQASTGGVYIPPATMGDSFPLKLGSKGERVKQIQAMLNLINKYTGKGNPSVFPLQVDGIFGVNTEKGLASITGKSKVTESEYTRISKMTKV